MRFLDEYRNPKLAQKILAEIRAAVTQPWVIMEICGGQTHAIMKNGIDQLLPSEIELVHGPGCPVCVTPLEKIDRAIAIAMRPEVIFTSFGDMLRVPGSKKNLLMARANGADVRMIYSPLEAVKIARENPDRQVVFFAVGFETTAPGNAMAIIQAARENLSNFSELASHVLVAPAMRFLLSQPSIRVQGFLAAGHVCTVMGWEEYEPLAEEFKVPIVPTGFEPIDILEGILMVVQQLEKGQHRVENQYVRSVRREGNPPARKVISQVFEVTDTKWRGMGILPSSGLSIRDNFAAYDAEKKFKAQDISVSEPEQCISGQIMQGLKKPPQCDAFGRECAPEHPLGATMVSNEGACAAYYKYQQGVDPS